MKAVIKWLLTVTLVYGLMCIGPWPSKAVEMETDVGIEFTEIEPAPSTSSEPPVLSKPPIVKKPIVRLPQTSETVNQSSVLTGGSLIVGASLLLWKKRKEGELE